jgi:hypothetical protein
LPDRRGLKFPIPEMSKKITVVGENRQIKRSAALTLVRRGAHEWVAFMVSIRARPLREFNPHALPCRQAPKHYIPEELPPMETGGAIFRTPEAESWIEEHMPPTRFLKRRARLMRLALGFDKPRKAAQCL